MKDGERKRIEGHLKEIDRRMAAIRRVLDEEPAAPKKATDYEPSPQARALVGAWHRKQPLQIDDDEAINAYHKTIDDMHRLDGLDWNEITAIVRHAAEVWAPAGYIQSPSKLRRPSREYPELKTWQVIQGKMKMGGNANGSYRPQRPELSQ